MHRIHIKVVYTHSSFHRINQFLASEFCLLFQLKQEMSAFFLFSCSQLRQTNVKELCSSHGGHLVRPLPVLLSTSHALFIHRSLQFTLGWEDGLMVNDNGLNDLINVSLAGHGVLVIWYWHQCRTETNSQVVGIHHVFITVLRKTEKTRHDLHPLTTRVQQETSVVTWLTGSEMRTSISWQLSQAAEESQLSAGVDVLFLRPSPALKYQQQLRVRARSVQKETTTGVSDVTYWL